MDVAAYAVKTAKAPLEPFVVSRRDVGPHDVRIDIAYSGICHSDIHQGRTEWGAAIFPMVPGHEIAGVVAEVGSAVTGFALGDHVGVGCYVDSCRECDELSGRAAELLPRARRLHLQRLEMDEVTPTYGGYRTGIVVDENYVLRIPVASRWPRRRGAAAVRGHHLLLAAAAVERRPGCPGRGSSDSGAWATWASRSQHADGRRRHA